MQQAAMMPEQVQYYFQLSQNQIAQATTTGAPTATPQNLGTLIATTQAQQQLQTVQVTGTDTTAAQLVPAQGTPVQLQQASGQAAGSIQHILTNTGEIQQVQLPVGQQIQYVRQAQGQQQQQGLQQAGQEFVTQISGSQVSISVDFSFICSRS